MPRLRPCLIALVAGALAAAAPAAAAPPDAPKGEPPAVRQLPAPRAEHEAPRAHPATLLVRLQAPADAAAVAGAHGTALGAEIPGTRYRLLRAEAGRLAEVRASLERDTRVAAVEPNHVRSIAAVPTDPFFRKSGAQASLRTVRAPRAWDLRPSLSGAVVAVLDTGVDARHPDLAGRVLRGHDVIEGDSVAQDPNGHGTMVAGVAAAITNNRRGIAGLAWGASVLPVRVLDRTGSGTDADLAAGIAWAADNGADVINVSASGPGASGALADAAGYAAAKGALVVAAAGNGGDDTVQYPAAMPAVVAVGATHPSGDVAPFSSHGPWVDLVAPGVDVLSTDRTDVPGGAVPYAVGSGTSLASPLVAAAALLVGRAHPDWSPGAIATHLAKTAADGGPRGRDDYYGAGRLDAATALGAVRLPVVAPPRRDAGAPDDVPARARRLALSTEAGNAGSLSPEGDVDVHAISVPRAGWYSAQVHIPLEPPDDLAHGLDARLEVLDPDLRPLDRAEDHGGDGLGYERAEFYARRAGRHYLRVSNEGGGRPDYTINANPTTSPLQPDTRFQNFQRYLEAEAARGAAIADVTGDGRPDAITASVAGLVVHPQDDDGWLGTLPPLLSHGPPIDVAAGDVDGDRDADVLVTTFEGIDVYLKGPGGLGPPRLLARADLLQADVADLDGDGTAEILAAGNAGVYRYTHTSTGWAATRLVADLTTELEIGDVTGDGRRDLVTTGAWSDQGIRVRRQLADGTFAAPMTYAAATTSLGCCTGIEVADVTGDGRQDVIATQGGNDSKSVEVLAQTSAGTLGLPAVYWLSDNPAAVEAADVDGDGRKDVVVVHSGWENLTLFLQTTSGRLGPARRYPLPYVNGNARGLAIGDLSSDGAPDLLVSADYEGLAVVRQQSAGWPADRAAWVRSTTPAAFSDNFAPAANPVVTLGRAIDPASATAATVRLRDATADAPAAAALAYDAERRELTVDPAAALTAGHAYALRLEGLRDTTGRRMTEPYELRFVAGAPPLDGAAPDTRIIAGPERVAADLSPVYRAFASEPHVRYECGVDDYPWWNCGEYFDGGGSLPLGRHTVRIRAIDAAGRVDPTPVSRTYRWVDTDGFLENDWPDDAFVLSGASPAITGTNLGANKQPTFEPSPAGNPGGAQVWWKWTAPATQAATVSTAGSDFDTLLGVYGWTGDYDDAFVRMGESDDAGTATTSKVTFSAVAGRTYYIAVDGFNMLVGRYDADGGTIKLRVNLEDPGATPRLITGTASDATPASAVLHGTVDPNGTPGSYRFEYGTTTAYGTRTPAVDAHAASLARHVAHRVTGLSPKREYHYRVLFTSPSGATLTGEDQTFTTLAAAPGVTTLSADAIRAGSASLRASVAHGANWWVGVRFQYGTTTAYGRTTEWLNPYAGETAVAPVDKLTGATTYHYRAVAEGESGERVYGADRTFTTAPSGAPVLGGNSTPETHHATVTIQSRLDPNGRATTAWLEYGPTTAYGSRGPVVDAGLGTQYGEVRLRALGLEPVTTYHFRVVAQNGAGTVRSGDGTFTTEPPPPIVSVLAPTGATTTRITLNARVDPRGLPTSYGFDLRRYPVWQPMNPFAGTRLDSATAAQTMSTTREHLDPDTEYVMQAVAENRSGTVKTAPYRFRTPRGAPVVYPAWPSSVEGTGPDHATVRTQVNPAGPQTEYWYEYGRTAVDERRTAATGLGSGSLRLHARARISGLAPATTYKVRVVARNALGTTRGPTETFTTQAAG